MKTNTVLGNCEEEIQKLANESIDIICIDPPYLYLKGQKLEREFNEVQFFGQCKRVLTKNGFLVMFGRGVSFYRWNTILADLGFSFKEEIVWDKRQSTSPMLAISRVHETVSVWTKGKGTINKVYIPYLEAVTDIKTISMHIKQISSSIKNVEEFDDIMHFLKTGETKIRSVKRTKKGATIRTELNDLSRGLGAFKAIKQGMIMKSILTQTRDHYDTIHPTQKPVRLLELLIQLCLPDKPLNEILVADFFAGSFSCGEACYNLGVNFLGVEIDEEYYNLGVQRLKEAQAQTKLF